MTRINTIPVNELDKKRLFAEYREITRIPNAIKSGRAIVKNIPKDFTLGKGHVKFFYDKLEFLRKRYFELYEECSKRKINITPKHSAFESLPKELCNDWLPTEKSKILIKQRINSKQ